MDHLSKPNVWIEFYLSLNTVSPEKCPNSSSLLILTWLLLPWLWNRALLNLADRHSLVFARRFDDKKAVHPMYVFMHKYWLWSPPKGFAKTCQMFFLWGACLQLVVIAALILLLNANSSTSQDSNKRCIASQASNMSLFLTCMKGVESRKGRWTDLLIFSLSRKPMANAKTYRLFVSTDSER